jgi:hypothetical protein
MDGTTRSELGKLRLSDLMRAANHERRATSRRAHPRRPSGRGEATAER